MDCFRFSGLHETSANPYELLVQAATLIPIWHYLLGFLITSFVFLHIYFDFHFLQGIFNGSRGYPVDLTYNSDSHTAAWFPGVMFSMAAVTYQRELFRLSDGGTIALDWAVSSYVLPKDDTTPIVVVLPGLTSDSQSSYIRHLAFNKAKMGWNVVISNHRELGGVPITSDLVYNCGWTNDIHEVCNRLHHKHPKAPLFLIGTSIDVSADIEYVLGANILVKYLGEDGDNAPVSGAAAISNPWDFLIGDIFIRRTLLQKFYDKALTLGL
ncbi:PREDICTED: embryogenesis-associated [Prunus dulcis]|uniref:PREDICTED: embryogenesis-associated n=1 Tax=Prunus dulcis TaxID=3755 RepID=A0A5E4G300_PRUDU|nr:PREDICTED: embryogenesis-associated [Prunus dulcis]